MTASACAIVSFSVLVYVGCVATNFSVPDTATVSNDGGNASNRPTAAGNNTNTTNVSNVSNGGKNASNQSFGVRLEPGDVYIVKGLNLMQENLLEEAAAHFLRATDVDPNATMAYFHLGTALYHLKNPTEAAKHLHYATLVLPQHAEAYLHLAVSLQEADQQAGEDALQELALQQLLHATELSPAHALAYSYLGSALYTHNYTEEALGAFQTSMELDPSIYASHHNYGMILLDELAVMNNTSEEAELLRDSAAVYFEDAVKLQPDASESHFRLGTIHHASGRVRDALRAYRRVLEISPDHVKAKEFLPDLERDARHEDAIDAAIDKAYDEV